MGGFVKSQIRDRFLELQEKRGPPDAIFGAETSAGVCNLRRQAKARNPSSPPRKLGRSGALQACLVSRRRLSDDVSWGRFS